MNVAVIRNLVLGLSMLLAASVHAQEFAIVVADEGYLVNDNDVVVKTVPFMSVLEVDSADETHLSIGDGIRISRSLVQYSEDLGYEDKSLPIALRAHQTLEKAFDSELDEDPDAGSEIAMKLAQDAVDEIQRISRDKTPATAWFTSYVAFFHYYYGDFESAHQVLDTADAILDETGQSDHLRASDILNLRAVIRFQEGDYDEAIRLLQDALLICLAEFGNDHIDCVSIRENLSDSYAAIGEMGRAIRTQQLAVRAKAKALPASAAGIPDAYAKLGGLQYQEEQYQSAMESLTKALELYRQHHDRLTDEASMLLQIGDAYEGLENYDKAEESYLSVRGLLDRMSDEDAMEFRKAMLNRQGLLDFGREDYANAMTHFNDAIEYQDPANPQTIDGETWESIGSTYSAQDDNGRARDAYVKALKVYAITEGENGDGVWRVDELILGLDGAADGSLDDVILVSELPAYMFDDDLNFLTDVPELTVLSWNARADETDENYAYYTAPFEKEFGNVDATQIRSGRMLPGYFDVSAADFKTVVRSVRKAWEALQDGDVQTTQQHLDDALKHSRETAGESSTLTLWVKMFEIRLRSLVEGPEVAAGELSALRKMIEDREPGDYPIEMDAKSVAASLLFSMNEAALAAEKYRAARDIAIDRLGYYHVDVMDLKRNLAKALFRAGNIDDAENESREALEIALEVYPSDVDEVAAVRMDYCLVLTRSDSFDEALEQLEKLINDKDTLDENQRFMCSVLAGRVLTRMGKTSEAEDTLELLRRNLKKLDAEISPPAAMIHADLGHLAMVKENWTAAGGHLRESISIHLMMGTADTFECACTRLDFAKSLLAEDNAKGAADQLELAIDTFIEINRSESPEAEEAAALFKQAKSDSRKPKRKQGRLPKTAKARSGE